MAAETVVDRRLEHQRLRNRMKQRRHKARYVSERQILEQQIEELSLVLAKRSGSPQPEVDESALSWQDVATALSDARLEAVETLEKLQKQHAKLQKTFAGAVSMATTLSRRDNLTMPARHFAFLEATLAADPAARRLGMDWFSQHLYHNTDLMMQYASFSPVGSEANSLTRDCGPDQLDLLSRIQIDYNVPLEAANAALNGRLWSIFRGEVLPFYSEFLDQDLTASIDDKLLYRRMVISAGEANFNVSREFSTPDRIVFVMGSFAHDERQARNETWIPTMIWAVLERRGPTTSRLRMVMYNGPLSVSGRFTTWQEEFAELHAPPEERSIESFGESLQAQTRANVLEKFSTLSLN
ncbi:hypothetical protein SPRG_11809 [Saprolegnia parasitica CBS 223.65]|uniref:BZIP domain-containing protein n=1 Tax=Saprolegnia parasitica (strain CBS 223.65) TaxID=695850 RepID=A0A067C817_SAPPC|nr:hypothetical protein SPRG_11809 [Saprolegnia parasitica CBS 223.65]KDO22962.1 hypothetical protein SPRG_11809 [Saprolegnia parasitica CBS 223.65]|eukprot:XP_012206254.1 hypothetical protein SPRG_11809 [Saprolegnia parasitica CBS 223.65]